MNRRRFLIGASALLAAPAIVRASNLMALPLGPNIVHRVEFDPLTGKFLVSERCRYRTVVYGLAYVTDGDVEQMRFMDRALRRSMQQCIDLHPYVVEARA